MKKTYINPEVLVELLSEETALLTGTLNTSNPTSGLDDEQQPTYGGDAPGDFSRRSVWDNNGDMSDDEF